MSSIFIIWVSPLVLITRCAEGGKWNGHINRSWPRVIEILTLLTGGYMKNHFLQSFCFTIKIKIGSGRS